MVEMVRLERCEICQESGDYRGIFHKGACVACNGGGLVLPSGDALEPSALVEQLRLRLTASARDAKRYRDALEQAGLLRERGPADDYRGNNRRGYGGAHRTGD